MDPPFDAPDLALQLPILSPTGQPKRQSTLDQDSLLYKTYDDYFNTEEELLSPQGTLAPSLLEVPPPAPYSDQRPSSEPSAPKSTGPFFFVLSSTSPVSPHSSYTPISKLNSEEIPDILTQLLPQPSSALLEVIDLTPHHSASLESGLDQPVFESRSRTPEMMRTSRSAPSTPSPSPIPMQESRGRPRPQRIVPDLHSRVTYPSTSIRSSSVPRTRFVRSTQSLNGPRNPACKHVRGRSSPFPLPIQFSFAPSSVPGSTETSYSYF